MAYNQYQRPDQPAYSYEDTNQFQQGGPMKRIFAIGAIFLAVLVFIVGGLALVSSLNADDSKAQLSQVVYRQELVLDLIDDYKDGLRSQEALNETASIEALTRSNLKQLQNSGIEKAASSSVTSDSQTEDIIKNATSSSDFDTVFLEAIRAELANNQNSLNAAFNSTTDSELKAKLEVIIKNEESLASF